MNVRLASAITRTRAALLGTEAPTSSLTTSATVRPIQPPAPLVRLTVPVPPPVPVLRPSCAPLELVTIGNVLKAGPRRLLELLHSVAVATVATRAYPVAPSQVTIHQPQELLAKALGCHVVTVWRWTAALEAVGLLDARAHFTTSNGTTRTDGTLYAVSLRAGHRAHLPHDDLKHEWRDLDGDRAAGRTAWKILQGSDTKQETEWKILLQQWAVAPGSTEPPVFSDPCRSGPGTLQDVMYLLPLLSDAHPDKRPALVGMMASTMSHALRDPHSRRYWCKAIWSAWRAELEGRAGLQVLAAQVARLSADLKEWPDLRRPGALLASRLRVA